MSVFSATTGDPVVIKADKAVVTLDGKILLATDVNINYQRNVSIVPVLSEKRVMSIGEPSGTITMGTLLISGEHDLSSLSIVKGNGCVPAAMTITFKDNNCINKNKTVRCTGCICNGISLGMQAARGYVASGVSIVFTGLDV